MIYVMLFQAAVISACLWVIVRQHDRAAVERRELEDRLMAICQPVPLMQVMSNRDSRGGEVRYVDEEQSTARGEYDAET